MATITFTRNSGGVTIAASGRSTYANPDPSALVEILGASSVWITMKTVQAQFSCVLADTITINGALFSGTLAQLQTKRREQVFYEYRTRSELAMAIQMMGGTLLGESIGLPLKAATSAQPLAAGALRMEPIIANFSGTCTGCRFNIATPGVYTANNFNGAAVFDLNAGTMNRLAISADTPNVWTGAGGYVDLPFTAPIQIVADQLYVVQFLYNSSAQTT